MSEQRQVTQVTNPWLARKRQIRVAKYRRISQDDERTADGVRRQYVDLDTEVSKHASWTVVADLEDNDMTANASSKRWKPRPDYDRLLDMIRAGEVDLVIATELSRITRTPLEGEEFMALVERHRVAVWSTSEGGDLRMDVDSNITYVRIRFALAKDEAMKTKSRVRATMRDRADRGGLSGGVRGGRHFGYQPFYKNAEGLLTMDPHPVEAPLVRECYRMVLEEGATYCQAAAYLRASGVPQVLGSTRWTSGQVRQMLTRGFYGGMREHDRSPNRDGSDRVVIPGVWPGLVEYGDVLAVRALANNRRRGPKEGTGLLMGLNLVCGVCGGRLFHNTPAATSARTIRTYGCQTVPGGHVKRKAERVEDYVVGLVLEALVAAPSFLVTEDPIPEGMTAEERTEALKALDVRMRKAVAMWTSGTTDDETYEEACAQIKAQRAALAPKAPRSRSKAAPRVLLDCSTLETARASWDALSLEGRRAVLGAAVVSVTILRSGNPKAAPETYVRVVLGDPRAEEAAA